MNTITLMLPKADNYFFQEAFKVLRTNLQFCGQDVKVIALTSCYENEGKTTVSLNIGKSFAELGKKVLIIDADMRKSVMAGRNSDVGDTVGLSEVLTGMNSFAECVCKTQYPHLHILFAGKYPPNPVELLASKYFTELIRGAKQVYDYVIIDTPPLGCVIDAAVIAAVCDGTVLVLGNQKVRCHQAQEVIEQLRKSGKPVLGAIRNFNKKIDNGYYRKYEGKPYGR